MHKRLTTNRLLLRPRTINDMEACLAMDRDPLVTQYIQGPWGDPEKHRAFLTEKMRTVFSYPLGYWTVTWLEHPDQFLGWIMVLPVANSVSDVEIGWRLTCSSWGQGVATEATLCVLKCVQSKMPEARIVASIDAENSGSILVAEKVGLIFDREESVEGVRERFYSLKPKP